MEVLPKWGILKRFSVGIDRNTYQTAVETAQWIFDRMLSHPGGPAQCFPAALWSDQEPPSHLMVKSYLSNLYLHFENIRTAALAGDFALVEVGYYRNEQLVADRIWKNPFRQQFIACQ